MQHLDPLVELEQLLSKLIRTPHGRRAFLVSLPLLMAACSTPRTRMREGDNTGQSTKLSVQDETRMTQEVLPELQKQYPPVPNPELQTYISSLGQKIVRANHLEGAPYRYSFTLVQAPYVNAFALPAGTVFVTAPLVQMAETEAELAGVIGHEVGHIQARHTAERMDQAEKAKSKSLLFGIGGGILGAAAGFGLGKALCPPQDKTCLTRAAALGAAAGAGGGLLIQKFAFMANSREDEMEADRIGFKTAYQAGYSKEHVGDFYAKLLKMEQESQRNKTPILSSITDALSTHPPSEERVVQMLEMKSQASAKPGAIVSSRQFDRAKLLVKNTLDKAKAAK